jgi:intracellular sulfur oxidation DsrE/DsrF family protein
LEFQMGHDSLPPRRRFLGSLALAGAALALPTPSGAQRTPTVPSGPDDWDHRWLARLTRPNMLVFDTTGHGNGDLFGGPTRYLDAMRDGYGVAATDVVAVMALHGTAWVAGLDDERWARHAIGRAAAVTDPDTTAPATRNIFRTHADRSRPTLESVQARGTIVLVCNNTLRRVSRELAAGHPDRTAETVYADLRAGILPGVTVVPAVLAALQMAQTRGCAYARGTA